MYALVAILAVIWLAQARKGLDKVRHFTANREPGRRMPRLSQTMNCWRGSVTPIDYRD